MSRTEKDVKEVKEICEKILKGKLSRRNILVFVCQIEKIQLEWMSQESEVQNDEFIVNDDEDEAGEKSTAKDQKDEEYGHINNKGEYFISEK